MHHSYIVRVYRLKKNNPRMLVGIVEKVGEHGKTVFTNLDELWEIVNAGARRKRNKRNIAKEAEEGKRRYSATECFNLKP